MTTTRTPTADLGGTNPMTTPPAADAHFHGIDLTAELRQRIEFCNDGITNLTNARNRYIAAPAALDGHPTTGGSTNITVTTSPATNPAAVVAQIKKTIRQTDPKPTRPASKKPATKAPAAKKTETGPHACTVKGCGRSFKHLQALSTHLTRSHGKPGPAPAPKPTEAAPSEPRKPGELHLACDTPGCGATFEVTEVFKLGTHCRLEHNRTATPAERTPVKAQ